MDFSFYQILIGKWVVKVTVAIVSRVHFITPITTVASLCLLMHKFIFSDEEDQSLMDPKVPNNSSSASSALKQMEQMMGRNYSDFMRSLAAKYNQKKE